MVPRLRSMDSEHHGGVAKARRRASAHPRRADAERSIAAILAAATVCFGRNPHASMTEIAAEAGVGRVTLYGHFSSREELLGRLMSTASELVAQAGTESGDAREGLRRATLAWLIEARNWRAARYAPLGSLPRGTPANVALRTRMLDLFERGQRDGTIRTDLTARELMESWTGLIIAGMAAQDDRSPQQRADTIVTLLAGS